MNLKNKEINVWNKAEYCDCDSQDCKFNHKICAICKETILYTAHQSNQPTSRYAWNVDHKIPESRGGSDRISNLQAVHVMCNQNKGNSFY